MNQVALCVTCVVDQVFPEIGVATVRLLRWAGYEVDFPAAQTCCGQPFFNSGFRPEARRLAQRAIEIFEPYEVVVLPSGSCTTMIRLEYLHLFEDDPIWHERAKRLAAKTFELSEFLAQRVGDSAVSATEEVVTYHDSCHMCRMLGVKEQPRQLLQTAGYKVVEMTESNRCCGFGGLFSVRMPEVSQAMTAEKLHQATHTLADVLVTADPGCLMQMRTLASQHGVRVEHLATLLEAAMPNNE